MNEHRRYMIPPEPGEVPWSGVDIRDDEIWPVVDDQDQTVALFFDQDDAETFMDADFLRELVIDAFADTTHVATLGVTGWALQHPLTCRANMLQCPAHLRMMKLSRPPKTPGLYSVTLTDPAMGPEVLKYDRLPDDYRDVVDVLREAVVESFARDTVPEPEQGEEVIQQMEDRDETQSEQPSEGSTAREGVEGAGVRVPGPTPEEVVAPDPDTVPAEGETPAGHAEGETVERESLVEETRTEETSETVEPADPAE